MKLSTIQIVNSVSEITPSLFLTSAYAATRENIERRGISLLVNCAQECPRQDHGPYVESVKVSVDDTPYAPINAHFDSIADKIHEHVHRGGRCMIHCLVGVSRSTTLLLAYLMKHRNMSLKSAFDMVSAKRSVVRPNPGFWRQLLEYEKKLMSSVTNSFGSNFYNRHTEIPIHITPRNQVQPESISRPFSSAASSSPTTSSTYNSSSRYIPVTHQPSTANNYNMLSSSINRLNNNDFGISGANSSSFGTNNSQFSSFGSPVNRTYMSNLASPSPLLDKFRKQSSYFDKYVPAFGSGSNMIVNDDIPRFGRSSPPYSTTYRSSYGRF